MHARRSRAWFSPPSPSVPALAGRHAKTWFYTASKSAQVDTYTLTEKVGDELKLAVQIQQTALPQTVTFDEEGVEMSLESFKMNATGEVIANLNALESNASAKR